MTETDIITQPSQPLAPVNGTHSTDQITQLLQSAVDGKVSVEAMEKLISLYNDVADRQAKSEFAGAMAAFQAECPPIPKTSTGTVTKDGNFVYSWKYAGLGEIAKVAGPVLHSKGLSYSWDSSETDGRLTCTCIVRHINGHTQSASFTCPIDERAKMSDPQKCSGALTLARRQSLIQALGLTTTDDDNDGGDDDAQTETIGPGQTKTINDLLADTDSDLAKFLIYMEAERVEDITTDRYESGVVLLENKVTNKKARETEAAGGQPR